MNTTLNSKPAVVGEASSSTAFELAKKALGFIVQYGTPPTPEVYEVWYRFAEGLSKSLDERMTYLMNVVGSISSDDLDELKTQFLSNDDVTVANESISLALASEISNLKSLVGDQLSANDGFSESISSAKNSLDSFTADDADLRICIQSLSECTNEISNRLQETGQQLEESQRQVDHLKTELTALRAETMMDPLTGLGNRRFLREALQSAIEPTGDAGIRFLLMIDLDNFKDVNDSFGHLAGDETLVLVASELRRLCEGAAVGRYGGDEFLVVNQLDDPAEVHQFAENIRETLANLSFTASSGEQIGPVTVSVGVARLRAEESVQNWLARVDSLTYSAKASGKNFVMIERNFAAG